MIKQLRQGGTALLLLLFAIAPFLVPTFTPVHAAGASLTLSPTQGEYFVDSTFEISILVNTGGSSINAVEAHLTFPADKLQVVNPTVSQSFIQIWTNGPSYSNTNGTLTFQGGLPSPGITTSAGIISTVQFRAKAAGKATIKFTDDSKVLANDGSGTNILTAKSPGSYEIKLPAPGGPIVSSPTHEDQNKWYRSRSATLNWETADGAKDFSYLLDQSSGTIPEQTVTISDTTLTTTLKSDGIWYFHIRAKNGTGWGGTTHYSLKVDSTGPAEFAPQLDRKTFSEKTRELARFTTTDATSGIDHYEAKIANTNAGGSDSAFFTEQQSPYQLPELPAGSYQLIVRAYDVAGNYTDGTVAFTLVRGGAAFAVGVPLFSNPIVNNLIIGLLTLIILILLIGWWRRRRKAKTATRLQADLTTLHESMEQKQAELQALGQLQTTSRVTLDQISRRVSPPSSPTNPASNSTQRFDSGQSSPTQQR